MDNKIKILKKIERTKDSLDSLNKVIQNYKGNISPEIEESFNLLSEEYIDHITELTECLKVEDKNVDKFKVIKLIRNGQWF